MVSYYIFIIAHHFLLLVHPVGLKPTTSGFEVQRSIQLNYRCLTLNYIKIKTTDNSCLMEQVVGIEPTFPAWKAGVLPIYDTCILSYNY